MTKPEPSRIIGSVHMPSSVAPRRAWKRLARRGELAGTHVRRRIRRLGKTIRRLWRDSLKSIARTQAGAATAAAIARASDGVLAPLGWRAVPRRDVERLALAQRYELYWYKAYKKIEIRDLDGFGPIAANAVREHRTGMRHDRLYTLWQAVASLPVGQHPIVEVGAFRGGSARFIGESLQWHGRANPFFVCDTFEGHVVIDEALDGPHRVGEQFTGTSYESVAAFLAGLEHIHLVHGDFRETSAQLAAQAPFALAHLDVDVYPVMRHALEFFAPRMLPGSLIVVDDYGFTTCRGARQAADEFAASHREFRAFHLLTGQALLVRLG